MALVFGDALGNDRTDLIPETFYPEKIRKAHSRVQEIPEPKARQ